MTIIANIPIRNAYLHALRIVFFFGSNKYIMTVDVNVTDFFVL